MTNYYNVLKNRLCNGVEFMVSSALDVIEYRLNNQQITIEQADELRELANKNGVIPTKTLEERIAALEAKALQLEMRDMEHDEAIMELAGMLTGEELPDDLEDVEADEANEADKADADTVSEDTETTDNEEKGGEE